MSNIQFNQTEGNMHSHMNEGMISGLRDNFIVNLMVKSPIEDLQLQVDQKNTDDIQQLNMIVNQIFRYPSVDLAKIHRDANRLGQHDIRKDGDDINQEQNQTNEKVQYCNCCGFIKQDNPVKICTSMSNINNVGISTFLYFQTLKNLSILLILAFIFYGCFAIVTNIISSLPANAALSTLSNYTPKDFLIISIAPKEKYGTETDQTFLIIQCWIGMALLIVWMTALIFMKYYEKEEQVRVGQQTISAADFSIVVQHMPTQLTKQEVQQQLNAYYQTIKNVPENLKRPLTIKNYNIGKPFYLNQADINDDQTQEITKQTKEMLEMFASWVFQRQNSPNFSTTKDFREEQYKKYDQLVKRKHKKSEQIIEKVKQEFKKENQKQTTTVFITFQTNRARALIDSQNSTQFTGNIRYYLTCCQSQNRFKPVTKDGISHRVKIARAPQPQDVIWVNLGVSDFTIITRKLITYIVTLILLGGSFAAVYGLSLAQYNSQKAAATNANSGMDYLSIIISVLISLINIILGQVIRRLTLFERDYTKTSHQTSLAIKIVAAQLINSIIVPIMANWFIKGNNLYEKNGLADEIFLLGITNSFITPGLKIVEPQYYIMKLLAWFSSRPSNRIWLNQFQLNAKYQLIQFQVGFEYIYIVNLFLFTCFYMSLQPIVIIFALTGYLFNYWAQKYTLFNRMHRPVPGTDLINVAMWQLILLGGIMYAIGSFCWTIFFPGAIPSSALIPNIIALVIGVVLFFFPFTTINGYLFSDDDDLKELIYEDNRIYLPSEYDRLNPTTAEKGLQDYLEYIEQFKKKMTTISDEQRDKIAKIFVTRGKRGTQKLLTMSPSMGLVNNIFNPPQQQGINPMLLGAHLMPNKVHMPLPVLPPQIMPNLPQQNMISMPINLNLAMQQQNQINIMQQQQPPRFAFQQQPQSFGFGFGQAQLPLGFGSNMALGSSNRMGFGSNNGIGGMGFGFR